MSRIGALVTELATDPEGLGYAAQDDATRFATLTTANQSVNAEFLTGDEIFNAAATAELNALTDNDQQAFISFCARDEIDPFGTTNVALIQKLFGGGSTTIANLQALRTRSVSRAEVIGLSNVSLQDVIDSRTV